MIPPGQFTGAVLAGGRSQRMGRDKASLTCDGRPLWARQIAVLREAEAGVIAVVRHPGQAPLGLPEGIQLWHDSTGNDGPLAGLHTALSQCRTHLLYVLAVDMPRIDAWWFQWLRSYCGSSSGAITCRPDGLFEPLAAIYPHDALADVTRQMGTDDHSLQTLAKVLSHQRKMRTLPLPSTELWRTANWNTPGDVASMG